MSPFFKKLFLSAAATASVLAYSGTASAIPIGWSCTGACGDRSAADGVVTLAPGFNSYQWLSTNGGTDGTGTLPVGPTGEETNGSFLRTPTFSVNAGDSLNFYFNYITSDGSQYTEYAWAGLFEGSSTFDSYLFTARTTTTGNTVPGFGLPGLGAGVTLSPSSTAIIAGGPQFSPLGGSSGDCFNGPGAGCGYTGWIQMTYNFASAGIYSLGFGVTNALDESYDSAFAIAGVSINDQPIGVPEPATLALFGVALTGLVATRRRRQEQTV